MYIYMWVLKGSSLGRGRLFRCRFFFPKVYENKGKRSGIDRRFGHACALGPGMCLGLGLGLPSGPFRCLSGPLCAFLGLSGPLCAFLGLSGPLLGIFWGSLGLFCAFSGPLWASLGLFLGLPGPFMGLSGPLWAFFWASLVLSGPLLGHVFSSLLVCSLLFSYILYYPNSISF